MHSLIKILSTHKPVAAAFINGSPDYPELNGTAYFYSAPGGSLVLVEAGGLPENQPFLAVHIHDGSECSGNKDDHFANAGQHLNFMLLGHPLHTGDLPPLLNGGGYAWGAFFTDRFTPCQVRGYTIVIHAGGDDFHTQPSGNAGTKIGCGVIMPVKR